MRRLFESNQQVEELMKYIQTSSGGENKFANIAKSESHALLSFPYLNFPANSHRVLISQNKNNLFVIVSVYGHIMSARIILSSSFDERFNLNMLICDWQKKNNIIWQNTLYP